jgi:hypothetical protein
MVTLFLEFLHLVAKVCLITCFAGKLPPVFPDDQVSLTSLAAEQNGEIGVETLLFHLFSRPVSAIKQVKTAC